MINHPLSWTRCWPFSAIIHHVSFLSSCFSSVFPKMFAYSWWMLNSMTADNLRNTRMRCGLAEIWGSAPTLFTATDPLDKRKRISLPPQPKMMFAIIIGDAACKCIQPCAWPNTKTSQQHWLQQLTMPMVSSFSVTKFLDVNS